MSNRRRTEEPEGTNYVQHSRSARTDGLGPPQFFNKSVLSSRDSMSAVLSLRVCAPFTPDALRRFAPRLCCRYWCSNERNWLIALNRSAAVCTTRMHCTLFTIHVRYAAAPRLNSGGSTCRATAHSRCGEMPGLELDRFPPGCRFSCSRLLRSIAVPNQCTIMLLQHVLYVLAA